VLVCWSVGGGVGTSVVAAGLALAAGRAGEQALVVDLGGDQPTLFGASDPPGPGVAEWLRAAPDVDGSALGRLEVEVAEGIGLLPRGDGALAAGRGERLVEALDRDDRRVVVDAGLAVGPAVEQVVAAAEHTVLVARACPLSLRRIEQLPVAPTGVVVVRDRRRSVTWHDVAAASGAPVVAELEVDPAVAAAVDAGLGRRPLPRSFLRVLGELW
jgi:cellulose biosynthesis protein BcsQ